MTKLKDILIWYKLSPNLNMWFGKSTHNSFIRYSYEETHYGGDTFKSGIFALINLRLLSIHLRFDWWKLTFKNNRR